MSNKVNIDTIKIDVPKSDNITTRDLLYFYKVNGEHQNVPLVTKELLSDITTGKIPEREVTIRYLSNKIITDKKEYPLELVTIDNRKKKEIENSTEPIFLKGTLKYNLTREKFALTSFEKIDLFFDLNDWISIISQLSFDEVLTELLTGLNMNGSKLLLKEKHMFLTRLIPLVQKQFLLIDFSKRATRKTRTYSDLGYHIPDTHNFTRAKIIYDLSQRKKGLIFDSKGGCLILDEFQNNMDDGITMAIQQYKNDGTISDDKGNVMPLNTSVVILGNPKIPIEYPYIFTKWQNIFEGTTIYRKNFSTGDAFLSRVDCLIPSWESRVISKEMILNNDATRIPPYILRSVFNQLREIDISDKAKLIIEKFKFQIGTYDSRSQNAIESTFEGLIKLLLPQLIKNDNYENYQKELRYLYNLALEGRIIVNNMLQKIKPENIPTDFYFSTASYFNKEKNTFILPHRKITIRGNEVIKEALDTIGLSQNKEEIDILKKYNIQYHGDNLCFKHSYPLPDFFKDNLLMEIKNKYQENKMVVLGIGAALIGTVAIGYAVKKGKIKSMLKGIGGISALGVLKKNNKKIIKTLFDNKNNDTKDVELNTWNDNIFFNYLLGEHEDHSEKDMKFLNNISFYHRIKK